MIFILLLICAFALELSSDLKKMIASNLNPRSEMKMNSMCPKMQKNRIYKIVKVPWGFHRFQIFQNAVTGEYLTADKSGRPAEKDDFLKVGIHRYAEETLVWIASKNGCTKIVKFLVEQILQNSDLEQSKDGEDLDRSEDEEESEQSENEEIFGKSEYGETAVWIAAKEGHIEIVKFFAEQKVDLECANLSGCTPVWIASANGRTEIVKFLAEQKVDLERADNYGCSPVWIAAKKGHTEIVKFLVGEKVNLDSDGMFVAVEKGHTEIVRFLAKQNVNLHLADKSGRTLVWIAAANGHTEIVKFLAEQKVDLEKADNNAGYTPVWIAAATGNTEIVKFLIDQNVNVDDSSKRIAATEKMKKLIAKALKK
jgi:hypothetical protein